MAPVSHGKKTWPRRTCPSRGPMRHGHTVGLDIPRQVARLQSLTPLLQARVHSTVAQVGTQSASNGPGGYEVTRARFDRSPVKIESGTQVASRGPTWRTATPLV